MRVVGTLGIKQVECTGARLRLVEDSSTGITPFLNVSLLIFFGALLGAQHGFKFGTEISQNRAT